MHLPKMQQKVSIVMLDGEIHAGQLYTYSDERVVDLMNDERRFIPFYDRHNKQVLIINKREIRAIHPIEPIENQLSSHLSPYPSPVQVDKDLL